MLTLLEKATSLFVFSIQLERWKILSASRDYNTRMLSLASHVLTLSPR